MVLWFGGLYPWFRVEELLEAMLELSKNPSIKFVFVGGKNPFNPNPDFFKQYDKTVAFAAQHNLTDKSVFFVDWVDYDTRVNWYAGADFVISLNQPGEENRYSWRTRVMDYVWGELAILTNGGDPLSEDLISAGAAIRLPDLSGKAIVASVQDLYKDRALLAKTKQAITILKPSYHWQVITAPLKNLIDAGALPFTDEQAYRRKLGLGGPANLEAAATTLPNGKLRRAISAAPTLVSKVRKKGVLRSAQLGVNIARTQTNKHLSQKRHKRYVFISHPMDMTGAPLVLMQIIEEFAHAYGGRNILVVTPGINPKQARKLRELGVRVDKAVFGIGFRFIRMQLGLRKDDFVLMNTTAIYDNYRDFILLWLKTGRLKHAYWFIHEDKAQLPVIHKEFLDKKNIHQMHKLLNGGKLSVIVPSQRTKAEYDELLDVNKVQTVNLHVEVDEKFKVKRPASDYSTLKFLISGTPSDGRKGQLLALAAFQSFLHEYYDKNPSQYRDFTLHLVAIGKDYVSQQIGWVAESLMKDHVVLHPSLSKDQALAVTAGCNVVICCSLNETFGLYIAEGMFMGHVVLRNNSAGIDEQLQDGVNGYFIDHTNIKQFAGIIEKLLNKKTTSDTTLAAMGQASQEIIAAYSEHTYLSQIKKLQ